MAFLFLLCLALPLRAATVTASLDRPTAAVGESVGLSLAFEGGEPASVPSIPSVPGLSIQYTHRSSHISIVQSRTSSTVSHNYAVTAAKEGDYVIPAIQARVGGQVLSTQPVRLKVAKNAGPGAEDGGNVGFLRIVLPRTNVFVGEAFPLEIQLYAQGGQLRQMPQLSGDGFTVGKLVQEGREAQVQVGNAAYYLLRFKAPIVVLKTGDLKLTAGECVLEVQYRRRNARNRNPLDPFAMDPFDDFFGRTETRRFTLSGEPVTLHAQPLPTAGQPAGFSGAVGRFEFSVEASPTNVATGDPITLRMLVKGTGALDALQGFNIDWPGFKTYPPTAKTEFTDPLGLVGTRSFEQVIVPEKVDLKEIPPILFSFFDPEARAYRTLRRPAIPLTVRPSGAAPAAPTVLAGAPQPANPPRQDILHIKPRVGPLALAPAPLLSQNWFLALQTLPPLLWIGLLLWRTRVDALAANPRLRRRRQVAKLVAKGLAELPRLATQGDASAFYAAVFHLLQEQLGERLDQPASAITEAVLDERLRPQGAPDSLVVPLHELFQACNAARYAPNQSGRELTDLVPKLRCVLADLQKLP